MLLFHLTAQPFSDTSQGARHVWRPSNAPLIRVSNRPWPPTDSRPLYCPTDDERAFIAAHARGDAQQLTLLTLLKCQQHLGYLPALAEVSEHIRTYLCQQLNLLDTAQRL